MSGVVRHILQQYAAPCCFKVARRNVRLILAGTCLPRQEEKSTATRLKNIVYDRTVGFYRRSLFLKRNCKVIVNLSMASCYPTDLTTVRDLMAAHNALLFMLLSIGRKLE
jgi:hypothetical protein